MTAHTLTPECHYPLDDTILLDFIVEQYDKYWLSDGVSENDFLSLFLKIRPPYIRSLNPTDTLRVASELPGHLQKYFGVKVELPVGFESSPGVCESIWPSDPPKRKSFSRPKLRGNRKPTSDITKPRTKWEHITRAPKITWERAPKFRVSKTVGPELDRPRLHELLAFLCKKTERTAHSLVTEIMGMTFEANYREVGELETAVLHDVVHALLIRYQ